MLSSLADNVAQAPAVRMAAVSLLLADAAAPLAAWRRVAYRTWFDPSHQVQAFTHSLLASLASLPARSAVLRPL